MSFAFIFILDFYDVMSVHSINLIFLLNLIGADVKTKLEAKPPLLSTDSNSGELLKFSCKGRPVV